MTIVCAAKTETGVVLAGGDSLVIQGDRKLLQMKTCSKFYEFPNFVIGMAGVGPIKEILDKMDSTGEWDEFRMSSEIDVQLFMEKYSELFAEKVGEDEKDLYEFLFLTASQIFCVAGPSVFEVESFWAIGSGSDFAIASLDLSKEWTSLAIIAAVKIACKYCVSCQGPVELRNLATGMVEFHQ